MYYNIENYKPPKEDHVDSKICTLINAKAEHIRRLQQLTTYDRSALTDSGYNTYPPIKGLESYLEKAEEKFIEEHKRRVIDVAIGMLKDELREINQVLNCTIQEIERA